MDNVRNEIYDRQAFDLIGRVLEPDSNCVDVGCHRGDYLRKMFAAAPDGHHFAFEPIPELAKGLRRDFPTVEVLEIALSDHAGTAEFFYFPSKPALSGLALREERTGGVGEHLQVRTARLDDPIPKATPVRLLKIDVEGAEGLVLAGARHLIMRDRPFVVLEHGKDSEAFGWPSDRLYEQLLQRLRPEDRSAIRLVAPLPPSVEGRVSARNEAPLVLRRLSVKVRSGRGRASERPEGRRRAERAPTSGPRQPPTTAGHKDAALHW